MHCSTALWQQHEQWCHNRLLSCNVMTAAAAVQIARQKLSTKGLNLHITCNGGGCMSSFFWSVPSYSTIPHFQHSHSLQLHRCNHSSQRVSQKAKNAASKMCHLDDTYYSPCGHWGPRIVRSHCTRGLLTIGCETTGCWDSTVTGCSRLETLCPSCVIRAASAERERALSAQRLTQQGGIETHMFLVARNRGRDVAGENIWFKRVGDLFRSGSARKDDR